MTFYESPGVCIHEPCNSGCAEKRKNKMENWIKTNHQTLNKVYTLTIENQHTHQPVQKNASSLTVWDLAYHLKDEDRDQAFADCQQFLINKYLNRHFEHLFYGIGSENDECIGLFVGYLNGSPQTQRPWEDIPPLITEEQMQTAAFIDEQNEKYRKSLTKNMDHKALFAKIRKVKENYR